jgi:hypothetical protein
MPAFASSRTAAEERTGLAWDALVKNEVFVPLGLNSAVVGSDPGSWERRPLAIARWA